MYLDESFDFNTEEETLDKLIFVLMGIPYECKNKLVQRNWKEKFCTINTNIDMNVIMYFY